MGLPRRACFTPGGPAPPCPLRTAFFLRFLGFPFERGRCPKREETGSNQESSPPVSPTRTGSEQALAALCAATGQESLPASGGDIGGERGDRLRAWAARGSFQSRRETRSAARSLAAHSPACSLTGVQRNPRIPLSDPTQPGARARKRASPPAPAPPSQASSDRGGFPTRSPADFRRTLPDRRASGGAAPGHHSTLRRAEPPSGRAGQLARANGTSEGAGRAHCAAVLGDESSDSDCTDFRLWL